jgi:hypothetical protein
MTHETKWPATASTLGTEGPTSRSRGGPSAALRAGGAARTVARVTKGTLTQSQDRSCAALPMRGAATRVAFGTEGTATRGRCGPSAALRTRWTTTAATHGRRANHLRLVETVSDPRSKVDAHPGRRGPFAPLEARGMAPAATLRTDGPTNRDRCGAITAHVSRGATAAVLLGSEGRTNRGRCGPPTTLVTNWPDTAAALPTEGPTTDSRASFTTHWRTWTTAAVLPGSEVATRDRSARSATFEMAWTTDHGRCRSSATHGMKGLTNCGRRELSTAKRPVAARPADAVFATSAPGRSDSAGGGIASTWDAAECHLTDLRLGLAFTPCLPG